MLQEFYKIEKMESDWEIIEENEQIKQDFKGEAYRNGLLRHKNNNWVFFPSTVAKLPKYKVEIIIEILFKTFQKSNPNSGDECQKIRHLGCDIS